MLAGEHVGMCFEPPGVVNMVVESYCGFLNHEVKLVFIKIDFSSILQAVFLKGGIGG